MAEHLDAARQTVREHLLTHTDTARQQVWVRINPLDSGKALNDLAQVVADALDNSVSAGETSEVITHLAFYAGFPASISAALIAQPLLQQLRLIE